MELWVRSQNRKHLIKVSNLVCGTYEGTYYINGYSVNEVDNVDLGIYKSEKRCLEILNEIHQRLIDMQTLELVPDSFRTIGRDLNCVYEMPIE